MRNLVLALSLFLMILLGWFFYQFSCDCCGDNSGNSNSGIISNSDDKANASSSQDELTNSDGVAKMSDYLMFNWSNGEPVLRDDWETRKNQIINGLADGEFLEITGDYRSDETNNTTFENLGLARANKLKDLISPPITSDRITLKSRLVNDNVDKNSLFASASFRNFVKTTNLDTSIPDRTIIRFPFNSDDKLDDRAVESYLDKVATRIKSSGERVRLTGHTDNVGSTASNIVLGQRRADIIKRYLINRGVSASKIITDAKGEASPIATNNTSAGRAENRRTELQIIN
jgi:outer membrane protein OmpA-like peptidoglycan-associated protein